MQPKPSSHRHKPTDTTLYEDPTKGVRAEGLDGWSGPAILLPLFYFVLTIGLCSGYCHHFANKETEAEQS